jgi:3-oxoacyl-[acyl-carrier protein] reductase
MKSRNVVITGGAGGIGIAAAQKFLNAGDTVFLWDIRLDLLEKAASQLNYQGNKVQLIEVNITQPAAVEAATEKVLNLVGSVDVLINNAGITRDASLQKMSVDQWQQVIDVNLTGAFLCTKAISKHMIAAANGRIINTASVVAHYGNYGQTNYVASKSGLIGMTKVWAKELGKYNITVNAVAPGFIATDMLKTVPEKIIEKLKERTALARMGKPEDIAAAYFFLASEDASFITASTLNVDGGLVL